MKETGVYIQVFCPDCGSGNIGFHGKNTNGKQRLICKNNDCSRKTLSDEKIPRTSQHGLSQKT